MSKTLEKWIRSVGLDRKARVSLARLLKTGQNNTRFLAVPQRDGGLIIWPRNQANPFHVSVRKRERYAKAAERLALPVTKAKDGRCDNSDDWVEAMGRSD